MLVLSSNVLAWNADEGRVTYLYVSGWDNKPNHYCFEIIRSNNSTQWYGVRDAATEENKDRLYVMLLSAQVSQRSVKVFYHPDAPNPTGPNCEIGNNGTASRGVQSISMMPQ